VPHYHDVNYVMLYSYALAGQCAILFGYWLGLRKPPSGYRGRIVSAGRLLTLATFISLVLVVPQLLYKDSSGVSITDAIADPGLAYDEKFSSESDALWLTIITMLTAPLTVHLLPLGIMKWREMRFVRRAVLLISLAGTYILPGLLLGTNKTIFDFVLPLPWLIALATYDGEWRVASRRPTSIIRRSRAVQAVLLPLMTVVVVAAGVFYFSFTMASREGKYHEKYHVVNSHRNGWSQAYGVRLPDFAESTIWSLCKYTSQGYDGLAGCLELPFEWCYGYGNSAFITRTAQRLLPHAYIASRDRAGFAANSYPVRLDTTTRYNVNMFWHTIYPWIASDLTFPGAIVFIGVMAFYLAQAWADALRGENPFAFTMVALLSLMFAYIPANNIILFHPNSLSAFLVCFAAWRWTRCA